MRTVTLSAINPSLLDILADSQEPIAIRLSSDPLYDLLHTHQYRNAAIARVLSIQSPSENIVDAEFINLPYENYRNLRHLPTSNALRRAA